MSPHDKSLTYERFLRGLLNDTHSMEGVKLDKGGSWELMRSDKCVQEFLSLPKLPTNLENGVALKTILSVRDLTTVDGQIMVYDYQTMVPEAEHLN